MPSNCPIVIIGDFNINLLTNTIQSQLYKHLQKNTILN